MIVGGVIYLALQFQYNRTNFWSTVLRVSGILIAVLIAAELARGNRERNRQARIRKLVERAKAAGLEMEVQNFITRFGSEKAKKDELWTFRGHGFLKDRINDFIAYLNSKGLTIDADEFCILLKHYIQEKEFNLTIGSVRVIQKRLDTLSGSDFERLLDQLYTARGYQVQALGGVGDQGGDLIANGPGERILIQAKRYKGSVGNAAVQEAAAARAHYDCGTAVVITTGHFTREASALAKTNSVLLIGRADLQQFLLEFLKESWV